MTCLQTTLCDKNNQLDMCIKRVQPWNQKITFRIFQGFIPPAVQGAGLTYLLWAGQTWILPRHPPGEFDNFGSKLQPKLCGIPNPCHLDHNLIWQFNHALLKWSFVYKCIYEIKKISEIWLKYKFNWSRIGTPSRLPSSAKEHLLIGPRSLQWHLGWNIWGIFQGWVRS